MCAHTHASLLSSNSTELTPSHLRNCYFGAGLFLLSRVSHKFFFALQTFPPGSPLPALLNRKLLFSTANSVTLPPSLTFRCHPSTASMPDCFDRPEIQAGRGISSLHGVELWQWGPLSNRRTQSPEPPIKKSWRLLGARRAAVFHSSVDWLPENSLCVPETTVEYAGGGGRCWGDAG